MSGSLTETSSLAGASGASTGYTIDQSMRIAGDTSYLAKTFGSGGDQQKWTLSFWIKPCVREGYGSDPNLSACFLSSGTNGSNWQNLSWGYGGGVGPPIHYSNYISNVNKGTYNSEAFYRDYASWYHIVYAFDSTQTNASDRLKIYMNGTQITDWDSSGHTDITLNVSGQINSTVSHEIGRQGYGGASWVLYAYLAEYMFIDSQQLGPENWGESNETTGQWVPIEYEGTFGTTGFYLDFADSTDFGKDVSGEDNHWSSYSLSSWEQTLDSPTNNFATINPAANSKYAPASIAAGNLYQAGGSGVYSSSVGTIGMSSGKWYAEVYINAITGAPGSNTWLGVVRSNTAKWMDTPFNETTGSVALQGNGQGWKNGGTTTSDSSGDFNTAGDIVSILMNFDDGEIKFWVNGVAFSYTTTFTVTGDDWVPCAQTSTTGNNYTWNFGQDSSFAGATTAQGNGGTGEDFYYTPPSGYKALNTDNLSAPAIALPGENFNIALHTGNDTNRSITGLGFQPDVIWGKSRTNTLNHYIVDSVRGVDKLLYPDGHQSQDTDATIYTAFGSDGFSLGTGDMNNTSQNYVNWSWKAGGAPTATNSAGAGNTPTANSVKVNGSNLGSALAGTMAVTKMSVNTTAGYSVLTYNGTASAGTLPHGLSVAPAMVITKELGNNNDWFMYHQKMAGSSPEGYYMQPNVNASRNPSATIWNNTAPTGSVFSVGTDSGSNGSGRNYVAYCFQEIEEYSKFGLYTGNLNADGPFAYCGFRPAFVWVKRTDSNQDWLIWDTTRSTYNLTNSTLYGGSNYAESSSANKQIDILSNGFKIRGTYDVMNADASPVIFIAFAESPFKTSNAR